MNDPAAPSAPLENATFVVAAPSGAGKTSLVRALVDSEKGLEMSVSHTTRAPRPGERDGEHYHFVDAEQFARMVAEQAFLEHANVHGHGYGTSRAAVEGAASRGCDLVLEIDWQGARQVRQSLPESRSIFILPPSRNTLSERLNRRNQDSSEVIGRRLAAAVSEMRHWHEFDYLVVNDDFDRALEDLRAIVRATRLHSSLHGPRLGALLDDLLS